MPHTPAPTPVPVNIVGIRLGYVLGGAGWLACFGVASQMGGEGWLNILTCLFGSTVGWWTGILMSPDRAEQGRFLDFRRAVSAFLSGFVLAKLDFLFEGTVARDLAANPIFIGRVFLFATTWLICAQFTYVARHNLGEQSARAAGDEPSATNISLVQRLMRIGGVVLVCIAAIALLYTNYLYRLSVEQGSVLVLLAIGALVLVASTTSVREWLLGKTGSGKKANLTFRWPGGTRRSE